MARPSSFLEFSALRDACSARPRRTSDDRLTRKVEFSPSMYAATWAVCARRRLSQNRADASGWRHLWGDVLRPYPTPDTALADRRKVNLLLRLPSITGVG